MKPESYLNSGGLGGGREGDLAQDLDALSE